MAAGRLPEHEQRILDEMEASLRHDKVLNRRLRKARVNSRLRSAWAASVMARGFVVVLMTLASVILLGVGISTSNPVAIWAFAATWPIALFGLTCARRRRTARRTDM